MIYSIKYAVVVAAAAVFVVVDVFVINKSVLWV